MVSACGPQELETQFFLIINSLRITYLTLSEIHCCFCWIWTSGKPNQETYSGKSAQKLSSELWLLGPGIVYERRLLKTILLRTTAVCLIVAITPTFFQTTTESFPQNPTKKRCCILVLFCPALGINSSYIKIFAFIVSCAFYFLCYLTLKVI